MAAAAGPGKRILSGGELTRAMLGAILKLAEWNATWVAVTIRPLITLLLSLTLCESAFPKLGERPQSRRAAGWVFSLELGSPTVVSKKESGPKPAQGCDV